MPTLLKRAFFILAGGASSRMGQNKALLKLANGSTLLELMLSKLTGVEGALVAISGELIAPSSIVQVPDIFSHRTGPVGGMVSCIQWLNNNYPDVAEIYFIPVDLPKLDASIMLKSLDNSATASYFVGHPLPLRLKFNPLLVNIARQVADEIRAGDNYSVKRFIAKLGDVAEISLQSPEMLENFNYYSQWEQFIHENSI